MRADRRDRPSRRSATRSARATVEGRWTTTTAVVVGEHPAQRLLDERLGLDVERGERVVEHEHARAAEHGPGEREPLPLAAGQRHPLLADPGVQAPRQVVREPRLGEVERGLDVGVGGASGRPRVTFSRTLAENRIGSSKAVATTVRSSGRATSRTSMPVDRHPAAVTSASRGSEHRERRLARPARADEREGLAGLELEVDVGRTSRSEPGNR